MLMQWSYNPDDGGLFQSEGHLVSLVVPQMVHSVALAIVEVFLLSVKTDQVSVGVKGAGQLFGLTFQGGGLLSGSLRTWSALLSAYEKLVVGTPMSFCSSVWRRLLHEPDSEVSACSQLDPPEHLIEGLLTTNEAHALALRPHTSLSPLTSSRISMPARQPGSPLAAP